MTDTPAFTEEQQRNWFESLSGRSDYLIWGVVCDGRPIGACGLKHVTATDAEYWGYIGDKSFWGHGYGQSMVAFCLDKAHARGLQRVYLRVLSSNVRAQRLYQRMGFTVESAGASLTMAIVPEPLGNHRPLVSFIVFAYNQERYVAEAIAGALAQTYSPLEIILSDDCSRDGTFAVMQRMAHAYRGPHRVTVNRNARNLGVGEHTNHACMDLSHGELIVMAAGDDISLPDRAATVYQAWHDTGRKAFSILSGYTLMREDGVPVRDHHLTGGFVQESVGDYLKCNRPIYAPGCVQTCHRDVFAAFGPLTKATHIEDNSITLRARLLGKVLLLDKILVKWRQSGAVSKPKNFRYMWAQEEMYRRETRAQLLSDLENAVVVERMPKAERDRTRDIALAGLNLAATDSMRRRIMGWCRLTHYCTFRENFNNCQLLHPAIALTYRTCRIAAGPLLKRIGLGTHATAYAAEGHQ